MFYSYFSSPFLADLKEFAYYQGKNPEKTVAQYFEDKDKVSDTQAARARKFLGY